MHVHNKWQASKYTHVQAQWSPASEGRAHSVQLRLAQFILGESVQVL